MNKYYYKQTSGKKPRRHHKRLRLVGLFLCVVGLIGMGYFFLPLLSWQLYLSPVFASQSLAVPIPKNSIVNPPTTIDLLRNTTTTIGIDYTNAENWFPGQKSNTKVPFVPSYTLSIPKLGLTDVEVSTMDHDLTRHLINYAGTAVPSEKGTAIVFGHSTLPQLLDQDNFKTIFSTLHTLNVGDIIITKVDNKLYMYRVFQMSVVSPDDTSIFTQEYDDSYLTLVTCTPPGTVWKRLVVRTKLVTL